MALLQKWVAGAVERRKTGKGAGCLCWFGLPFALGGVFFACTIGHTLVRGLHAGTWPQVPARVLSASLEEHGDSDGSTYQAVATYEYEYLGRTHRGARVSLHGGSDNIGRFQQQAFAKLDAHRRSGRPLPCYVNPENPDDAVLYPHPRLEMLLFEGLFALVFGGAGLAMVLGGLYAVRRQRRVAERQRQHPDEPWHWRDDWAGGVVRPQARIERFFALGLTAIWGLIGVVLLLAGQGRFPRSPGGAGAVTLILLATGVLLVTWTARAVHRHRRYAGTVFQMASVPGVLGGPLAGVVRVPHHLQPDDGFRVGLSCARTIATGGSDPGTREDVVWEDERVLEHELMEHDLRQSAIPVLFAVPLELPPSNLQSAGVGRVVWRLTARAHSPREHFAVSFEVPVFRTAQSAPDFRVDESALARYAAPVDDAHLLADARIRTRPAGAEGRVFVFPMARLRRGALTVTGILAGWTAVVVFLIRVQAPWVFPIVFGFFDLILFVVFLQLWFGTRRLEATRAGLVSSGGIFGIGPTRRWARADIGNFAIKITSKTGKRVYYAIELVQRDGQRRELVNTVGARTVSEALARALRQGCGIGPAAGADAGDSPAPPPDAKADRWVIRNPKAGK